MVNPTGEVDACAPRSKLGRIAVDNSKRQSKTDRYVVFLVNPPKFVVYIINIYYIFKCS